MIEVTGYREKSDGTGSKTNLEETCKCPCICTCTCYDCQARGIGKQINKANASIYSEYILAQSA